MEYARTPTTPLAQYIDSSDNNAIFFKALIESTTDGIVLLNGEGIITYQTPAAARISGYTTAEVINTSIFAYVAEESKEDLQKFIVQVLSHPGIPHHRSFKIVRKSGEQRWIEGAMTNLLDDPNINSLIANYRDVTERIVAENERHELMLQLSEKLKEISDYKYALDESSIVAITDSRGIIKYVNDNFCKISQYKVEELIGNDHRIINSGYHDKQFFLTLWKTISSGCIWRGEVKNKAKDGSYYWVDTTIVPFLNETGKPYQYVAIRVDITQRKLVKEKLKASEANLRTIFANTDNAFLLIDTDLKIKSFNQKAKIFAQNDLKCILIEEEDALKCFNPERRKFMVSAIKQVFEGKDLSYEINYPQTDGSNTWYFVRMLCVKDELTGTVLGLTMALTDITERKKGEDAIIKLNEELEQRVQERTATLEQVNRELEAFTYSVSHDLRSPARIVRKLAEILGDRHQGQLDNDGKMIVGEISNCANQMETLILDLLELSKSTSAELKTKPTSMQTLVRAVLHEIDVATNNNNVEIVTGNLPDINCDPVLMKQVWANLINNALKYSSKVNKPKIEIGSYTENSRTIYFVRDNGVGFDMRYSHKLFDVFQRLHNYSDFEGTGVGLALVQRIINRHYGKVWAEGEVDKGAVFYFTLPKQ